VFFFLVRSNNCRIVLSEQTSSLFDLGPIILPMCIAHHVLNSSPNIPTDKWFLGLWQFSCLTSTVLEIESGNNKDLLLVKPFIYQVESKVALPLASFSALMLLVGSSDL